MRASTRVLMIGFRHGRRLAAQFGQTRAERAAHLARCRAIRGGRASLIDTYRNSEAVRSALKPCPACGELYDATRIPPPRVPLDIRCACCCQ